MSRFNLFIPKQAVGANLVYFDLFNAAGSNKELIVNSVKPVVSGAVAVTGAVAVDLLLSYTSAVGTGGTAATLQGTAIDAATFTKLSPGQSALDALITARLTPTGGATAGAILGYASVFTEETNGGAYRELDLVVSPIIVPTGTGIRVVQGAVASVGNIGFVVNFEFKD